MRAIYAAALALTLASGFTAAGPCFAAGLVVPIDHSMRLSIQGQAASVVVGNPAVADVTVVDTHTLFVSGRGYGETDVVVLDRAGRTIYSGDVIVGAGGGGLVSVYRGEVRTDLACAPGCSISTRSPTAPSREGAGGGGGGGGSAPSNPLSALMGVAGGLGAAASSAAAPTAAPISITPAG